MGSSRERQVVSADLVGDIAIGSDAITAHYHDIHLAPTHQQSTGSINNHSAWHPEAAQFPGRQCSPLQTGTRFIQPCMAKQTTVMGGCNHPKGGSNASSSDRSRVAMMQDPATLSQQGNAMIHQPLGQETILMLKRSGYTCERFNINWSGDTHGRLHPIEGPAEVDGGWP